MDIKLLTTAYTNLLKKSVDVYDQQHQAIAQNVANINSDDYKRIDTDFSERLKTAIDNSGVKASRDKHIKYSQWGRQNSAADADNPEGKVDLAKEMTDLGINQIRHELVTRALSRHYSGITTAIVGRNR